MITSLSLAEQVAQMIVVRASGHLFDQQIRYPVWEPPTQRLNYWLRDLGMGGVIFVDGSAVELATRIQSLQAVAKYPLLLAADIEEGVGQRFAGATWFPPPMALGKIAESNPTQAQRYAKQMGAITAEEALAVGLNWVLAPVVDVNNNPENPVINIRAFGETPEIVSQLTTAFIQGCQDYSVLTTAKHFPGHGDTAVDSHLELPSLPHSAERLATIELPPFKAAIQAQVDAVMSAHLLIPAWDRTKPATLSTEILTGQLRQNLGFTGLIVTDALVMGAIANQYTPEEAAVLAVEAGADILLMPQDPEATLQAVCQAVHQERITPERIQESVQRIWQAKAKVYPGWKPPHPLPISTPQIFSAATIARPAAQEIVEDILDESSTLSQPQQLADQPSGSPPPVNPLKWNLVIVDSLLGNDFLDQQTPAIALPGQWGYQLHLIDSHTPNQLLGALDSNHPPTLLQLFVRGNPFRGSAGLTTSAYDWFKNLLRVDRLEAILIYGSPYALKQFVTEIPITVPYGFSYGQMPAAQLGVLKGLHSFSQGRV
ncbi:MAG: glycoside hydrolase family 3 N-terminal domain-containing protein [Microcoleaceae cyanobacterium]